MPCRDWEGVTPQDEVQAQLQRKNDELANMLCTMCRMFKGTTRFRDAPQAIKDWWKTHEAQDKVRVERDRAALEQQIIAAKQAVADLQTKLRVVNYDEDDD
jgi:uncharacterized protein (UPF0548 family)